MRSSAGRSLRYATHDASFAKGLRKRPQFNHAPRVRISVLMANGRYDFLSPIEPSQIPSYRLRGTPPGQKRRVVYNRSHFVSRAMPVPEVVNWLDRWLGSVR